MNLLEQKCYSNGCSGNVVITNDPVVNGDSVMLDNGDSESLIGGAPHSIQKILPTLRAPAL